MSALVLSVLLSAAPAELDASASLGASGTFLGAPSFQVGPRVSLGLLTMLGGLPLGARVSGQYDLGIARVFEVQGETFAWHRAGAFAPYAGVGLTVFWQRVPAFFLHALLGLEGRVGEVFGAFLELRPGVLLDRDGAVFWAGADVGVRVHFPVGAR